MQKYCLLKTRFSINFSYVSSRTIQLSNPNQPFPNLNFRPFQVRSPSGYAVHGDQLLSDTTNAIQNFADIYGAQLFQARDDISAQLTTLGGDSEFRAKLGKVKAAKFEKFADLTEEQRVVAVQLAEEAMNQFIDRVAQVISCDVRDYPGGYCIEFEIKAIVYKITGFGANGPKLKKVGSQVMNRDPNATLATSFGRWLNKFGVRRASND